MYAVGSKPVEDQNHLQETRKSNRTVPSTTSAWQNAKSPNNDNVRNPLYDNNYNLLSTEI